MSGAEEQVRAAVIALSVQAGDTNLPALIDKHRGSRNPEVRALARAAEAVVDAVKDLHWTSRRYCDGARSYAVGMHNDHTRTLLALGIPLNPTGDGTLWAADGDGLRGPAPEDMGEEWSSYQNTVTALHGSLDEVRRKRDETQAELAGMCHALTHPTDQMRDPACRYLDPAIQAAFRAGWQAVRRAQGAP